MCLCMHVMCQCVILKQNLKTIIWEKYLRNQVLNLQWISSQWFTFRLTQFSEVYIRCTSHYEDNVRLFYRVIKNLGHPRPTNIWFLLKGYGNPSMLYMRKMRDEKSWYPDLWLFYKSTFSWFGAWPNIL